MKILTRKLWHTSSFSLEPTDFKNVIVEKIPRAPFEVNGGSYGVRWGVFLGVCKGFIGGSLGVHWELEISTYVGSILEGVSSFMYLLGEIWIQLQKWRHHAFEQKLPYFDSVLIWFWYILFHTYMAMHRMSKLLSLQPIVAFGILKSLCSYFHYDQPLKLGRFLT
jgi:hypothetical protein